jgi:hypothetical protein
MDSAALLASCVGRGRLRDLPQFQATFSPRTTDREIEYLEEPTCGGGLAADEILDLLA